MALMYLSSIINQYAVFTKVNFHKVLKSSCYVISAGDGRQIV